MIRWIFSHPYWTAFGVLVSIVFGVANIEISDPVPPSILNFSVKANSSSWQGPGYSLVAGDRARLTPTGTWGVIDPAKRGENGPHGNGITAGSSAALPGGKEGCLIIRINESNPYCFSATSGSQIVLGPGEIQFRVNDDLGLGEKNVKFQSFQDNFGEIKVFIEINPK